MTHKIIECYEGKSSHYVVINGDQGGDLYCFLYEKYLRKARNEAMLYVLNQLFFRFIEVGYHIY